MNIKYWLCGLAAAALLTPMSFAREEIKVEGPRKHLIANVPVASEYWIGVVCRSVPPELQTQLGSAAPKDRCVLAEEIIPDSPAAKAGVQKYDVLLKIGEKDLTDAADIVKAVEESKGKPITLELLREGKKQTIEVSPAKRPEAVVQAQKAAQEGVEAAKEGVSTVEQYLNELAKEGKRFGDRKMQFRVIQPGAIISGKSGLPMPNDLSVTITRKGTDAAEITVKKGDQTWTAKENELDKLPAEVRPYADQMAHGGAFGFVLNAPQPPASPKNEQPAASAVPPVPFTPEFGERIEKQRHQWEERFNDAQKRFDDMQKRFEDASSRIEKRMEQEQKHFEEMRKRFDDLSSRLEKRFEEKKPSSDAKPEQEKSAM